MKNALLILLSLPLYLLSQTGTCVKGNCTNGIGSFMWDDGDQYNGSWKNDIMHGDGTFIWNNGDRYVGEFNNGSMHGTGVFYTSTGSRYEGSFKDGDFHGEGIYYWANGDQYNGSWANDNMHGEGTFIWAAGDKHIGMWKNDLRDGMGSYENERIIDKGMWKEGNRHGVIERFKPNGDKVYEIEYTHGEYSGYIRVYNKDGVSFEDNVTKDLELNNQVWSEERLTICVDDTYNFYLRPNWAEEEYWSDGPGPWELGKIIKNKFCGERVFQDSKEPVNGYVYEKYSNGNIKYKMFYKNGKYDNKWFVYYHFSGSKSVELKHRNKMGSVTKYRY